MGYRRRTVASASGNHVPDPSPRASVPPTPRERIANAVEGCASFHNQNGCSQVDCDQKVTIAALAGYAANPNIYGVVCVSLGCEGCQNDIVVDAIRERTNKPVETLVIQKGRRPIRAIEEGTRLARKMVAEADRCVREPTDISELIFGTNCGGPTLERPWPNPPIGEVSDWLVNHGATSVLCETPELFGAEHILARRAKDKQVSDDILKIVYDYEKYVQMFGRRDARGQPQPWKYGWRTHDPRGEVSRLRAQVRPVPSTPFIRSTRRSSIRMRARRDGHPRQRPSSVGGIIAGGCQLVVFSTGLGILPENAIAPVYRLTANKRTYEAMRDNTDLDASPTIYGPESMEEMRDRMLDDIIAALQRPQGLRRGPWLCRDRPSAHLQLYVGLRLTGRFRKERNQTTTQP